MVAAVGEVSEAWAGLLQLVPFFQDPCDQRCQLFGHRELSRFGHEAEIDRTDAFATAVIDGERGGAGFLVFLFADRHHDAVAANRQNGTIASFGSEGLLQPIECFADLGVFTKRRQAFAQRSGDLAQGFDGPANAVIAPEHAEHLALLVIDGEAADLFRQDRRGEMGLESQMKIEGED